MSYLRWLVKRNFFGMIAIAKKDIMLYYVKGPVVIFGLLFPLFLFLAFSLGRNLSGTMFAAPMLTMALFFTSSSVGPIIAPWETRMRTLEKLLTTPISVSAIVLGDVVAGFIYGMAISSAVFFLMVLVLDIAIITPVSLVCSMLLASLCFSSLGILLSSPPTDNPSNVMMLANMVKLPLIFISGVFVPLSEMSGMGVKLAVLSPLTYFVDITRNSLGQPGVRADWINIVMLSVFALCFLLLAVMAHGRNMSKRF